MINGGFIFINVFLYDKKQNIVYFVVVGFGLNEDCYQDVKQDFYCYIYFEVYQDQFEDFFFYDVFLVLIGGVGSVVVCGMVGWNG